ncbi:unnamed protein product [Penicillium salamii]|nr:unnamed protein product [Penicillium salamii]CAG8204687.1 unnamed protein product [Penicillium salamii]
MSHLRLAPHLKPEVRLAQVVSEFEAELSNEHKANFRAWRSKSVGSPPGIQDVMQLTAEIDRASEKRRRCLGPRLTNILLATQQFAAMGDIIVGGSQNVLACGVWAIVRMSLVLIIDFSSYMEKLSSVFMAAGRLAPRYEKMALLYTRSKDLQSSLCEYFILIVRVCHDMVSFARKSAFGKLTAAFSEPDLKTYQSELESWGKTIQSEVSFLMAKRLEDEANLNARFRAVSNIFQKSSSYHQSLQTKQRVLDFCSQYDCTVSWKRIRKAGTTVLFRKSTQYLNWKAMPLSSTLIYTARLGSGKSVLLANIVDDLHIDNEETVAYFFCRHDITESLKARTIIGSLARQLLQGMSDFTAAAEYLDKSEQVDPCGRLTGLIMICLSSFPKTHRSLLVIDGLDELDSVERDMVIGTLQSLQSDTYTILICLSLRDEAKEMHSQEVFSKFAATNVSAIPNNSLDIESFIEDELESRIESGRLSLGDPVLICEIQDALLEGSQGMFLWVALQIESLCTLNSDQEIRDALFDLPKDLSETFSRALRADSANPYQKKILSLLTAAKRPLTTDELREALCVVPGDLVWNPSRLLNNMYGTLACCGSLVTVDEEESTLHLVHHSVKQFLLGEFKSSTEKIVNIDDSHQMMAGIVLTYLNYNVFETQLSRTVIPQIKAGSLPSEVISSTFKSSSSVRSMAIKLLRSRKASDFDIGKIVSTTKPHKNDSEGHFCFFEYASSSWLYHVIHAFDLPENIDGLLVRLLDRSSTINLNTTDKDIQNLLSWSSKKKQYAALFQILLESGNMTTTERHSILDEVYKAAGEGHGAMVKVLLRRGRLEDGLAHSELELVGDVQEEVTNDSSLGENNSSSQQEEHLL